MPKHKPTVAKTTITVTLDPDAWYAFRVTCMMRKTTASKEISRFIQQQLVAWQQQTQKDIDHA